ncbi:MFS transporter (plasmid) [Burkholderia glumae]|uniref:MFS transporter n=1 Tax=Burkholderia glumae TaxID=337 RepID=A0ABY5BCN5_BURGL|nr:MFS transporter [Burkholderia glumae]USS44404.1 MFS transporter [Burkholderia glumae]
MSSTQTSSRVAAPDRASLTLATILLAIFVIPTSISGTAVALPSVAAQLQADLAPLQWVVAAFNLTFACFTLAWGALADIVGRKRAFGIGAALYVAASLLSATAGNVYVLDVARALAGIGAASIFAAGSALLATTFDDDASRMRAFAFAGAAVGIGVGVGPSLSGALVENFGWRVIFFVHAAIMVLVLVAIPRIRERAPLPKGVRIDVAGIGLFVAFALMLVSAIVEGSQWGWASAGVLGLFAGAAVALLAFVAVERRIRQPMLDFRILRNRQFLGWSLATVAPSFGFFTLLTYLPTYLSSIAGHGTGITGVTMLLLAVPLFVCPIVAGKLVQGAVPAKTVLFCSLVFLIGGDLLMHTVDSGASLWRFAAPMLLVGIGTGLSAGLADGQALGSVNPAQAGVAAGFLNTLRLGSETIAIALYGALLATQLHEVLAPALQALGNALPVGPLVNDVAAGNLAAPLAVVDPQDVGHLRLLMTTGYDRAFHHVVSILTVICVALSVVIVALLGPRPRQAVADPLAARAD